METPSPASRLAVPAGLAAATAVLTIDLDAIAGNWRAAAACLPPGARAAGVIKADAYGCGARRVLPALAQAGCRDFFVALIDEALAVRDLLPPGGRLFVLSGPPPGAEALMRESGLIPVLNSLEQIHAWARAAREAGTGPAPAAWHVDTGMTRLGLDLGELADLMAAPLPEGLALPVLLMSHLACADDPGHPLTDRQVETFARAHALLPGVPTSLGASSGIFRGPATQGDLVRPGALLYGLNPTPEKPSPVRPVVRLEAKILQGRLLDAPHPVGYGATVTLPAHRRLATVGVGYADGYPRAAGNRGLGVLAGTVVPVVGRISMDLITLDVTEVPPAQVHPGALVELLGPTFDADALAGCAGTIGYEILTGLGRRCLRVYLGGPPDTQEGP
ncbi:alanine racemase [Pararhodospirillum oryzae]|uniref:Alanine racemase n=1 Tax=Pararhodospirillum oryzae TaxID=478448 RepID=A0A512HAF6_9PROT|nr:alanine racemase [Pararhodospirillum oryzae]GEO82380.1 alanine racemase [Pararhodospirillum oryzae]